MEKKWTCPHCGRVIAENEKTRFPWKVKFEVRVSVHLWHAHRIDTEPDVVSIDVPLFGAGR